MRYDSQGNMKRAKKGRECEIIMYWFLRAMEKLPHITYIFPTKLIDRVVKHYHSHIFTIIYVFYVRTLRNWKRIFYKCLLY